MSAEYEVVRLSAVIRQMQESLVVLADNADTFHLFGDILDSVDTDAALRDHDAKVLEDAATEFETNVGIAEFDAATSRSGSHWKDITEAWEMQGPFMEWLRVRANAFREATS